MKIMVDAAEAIKALDGASDYSRGFGDGMQAGGPIIARKLGELAKELVTKYIDAEHNANPGMLHHVYEWGGSSRLFHMRLAVAGTVATITPVFQQSNSVSDTSETPFSRKAWLMEEGTPLHIDANPILHMLGIGEWAWTGNDVIIPQPGGPGVQGSFQRTFEEFFNSHIDALLAASGFTQHFSNAYTFGNGFPFGGYGAGRAAALAWCNSMPGGGSVV